MTDMKFALLAPVVALALLLVGCGGGSDDTGRAYCPPPLTVQDAAHLTRFKAGPGRDPRDIAFEAALVASGTTCELNRRALDVSLIMRVSVSAGPSVDAGVTQVPYFVRVLDANGTVVQGHDFTADFRLSRDNPRGTSQEELSLSLPYSRISDLAGYRIAVGLKPTPEELEYNRRNRGGR